MLEIMPRVQRTRTQALIDDDASRLSLSLQESDSVVFSMCWGAVLLKHKKIVLGQPVHVCQWPLSKTVVATVCYFTLTSNLSNLIVINPVLGINLEHPH